MALVFDLRSMVFLMMVLLVASCEDPFIPNATFEDEEVVVEGYVEAGEGGLPTHVILTRTRPFLSDLSANQINALFINNADVRVNDGDKTVVLEELCLSEVDEPLRSQIGDQFGFRTDTLNIDFCLYLDISDRIIRESGRTYTLDIAIGEQTLSAVTTIPDHVPLDSLAIARTADRNDSLAQMIAFLTDPAGEANHYRYLVKTNDGPFESSFSSVTDDAFFDGLKFDFQLIKPVTGDNLDLESLGLYRVGDTATIKWCTLDREHYKFWNTLEFAAANQGPFFSYSRVESNIQGGIGVWGGYAISIYVMSIEF